MCNDSAAPQGDGAPELEITPQMIDAGSDVLERISHVVSREFLAVEVYKTMATLSSERTRENLPSSRKEA